MKPSRAGYTLTELIMVVGIVGVIASTGSYLMLQLQNFYIMTTARNDIQRDARASLDNINRFIRQARLNTLTIDTPAGQGPYSRIRFTMADNRTVEFSQSGTNLIQTIGGATNTLSRNLIYIAFSFPRSDDPSLVSVSITMGKSIQLGRRKVLELTIQKIRVMNP